MYHVQYLEKKCTKVQGLQTKATQEAKLKKASEKNNSLPQQVAKNPTNAQKQP